MKRTGFIAIVGRPNVGKSTLLNTILGEKVAIVSHKPQTTRNRILGIETRGEDQYVFIDTPGMFRPRNSLGDYMVKAASSSMKSADALILVVDPGQEMGPMEKEVLTYAKQSGVPCALAVNKIDQYDREILARCIAAYAGELSFAAVVPISARSGKHVDELMDECAQFLSPVEEWFYDEDEMTDQSMRQLASEIIREKVLRTLDKEVPHGVAVVIEDFREEPGMVSIRAEIFVEKDTHKRILIGKNGASLKLIGTYARQDLEKMLQKKVFLDLWVKVKENWRDSVAQVTNFGYKAKDLED
ncbi:MAG: GTPase Era [Clostridia bacterium]|nr:GTPase Era [Clostridia bacterium]